MNFASASEGASHCKCNSFFTETISAHEKALAEALPLPQIALFVISRNLSTRGELRACVCERANQFGSYSPKDNFSPESGGRVKPSKAIDAIKTHGTIKLKK